MGSGQETFGIYIWFPSKQTFKARFFNGLHELNLLILKDIKLCRNQNFIIIIVKIKYWIIICGVEIMLTKNLDIFRPLTINDFGFQVRRNGI